MSPSPSPKGHTLRVLSFNVWGLALIAKERRARIRAIAEYIASSSYDIVCLQECWVFKDFEYIRDEVLQTLPHSRFFHTGALGSGLAIFTRFPLVSARAMPYSFSGTPQQAFAGDFFVNKAAGNVVVAHPVLGELEMHAAGEHPPDTRQAHRIAQAWQLSRAVLSGAGNGRYVMVMGDLNSQPYSTPIQLLRSHAGLTDAFLTTHPAADTFSPSPPSPEDAIHSFGMSCDSPLNSWSAAKSIPPHIQAQGGKRLDYILYRQPAPPLHRPVHQDSTAITQTRPPTLRCTSTEVVLTEYVPERNFSYSDHFGLVATFTIDSSTPAESPAAASGATIHQAHATLRSYFALSARSKRLHLRLSAGALVVLVALAVGSAWQPKSWIQPIFTVVAGLLGAAAATFFYLGFVWGRWEEGMLNEVTDEMDLELRRLKSVGQA